MKRKLNLLVKHGLQSACLVVHIHGCKILIATDIFDLIAKYLEFCNQMFDNTWFAFNKIPFSAIKFLMIILFAINILNNFCMQTR